MLFLFSKLNFILFYITVAGSLHGYWHVCMAITVQIGPALCKNLRNEFLIRNSLCEDEITMDFSNLFLIPYLKRKLKFK